MRADLVKYISEQILPIYDELPLGHSRDHVNRVMARMMKIGGQYYLNEEMCMTVAAYHDVGLRKGRREHELRSAMELKGDSRLRTWFAFEQIEVMWRAVEDHRSSLGRKPRSIYGRVIAEAAGE